MNLEQFQEYILNPTLKLIDMDSSAARVLLLGTAMVESNLSYIRQVGMKKGGAFGLFQCEQRTYDDVVKYIKREKLLHEKILSACLLDYLPPDADCLMWNLRLAVCIARVHYFRIPKKLPQWDDAQGLCEYYLKFYNTPLGKSTFDKSIDKFREVISKQG